MIVKLQELCQCTLLHPSFAKDGIACALWRLFHFAKIIIILHKNRRILKCISLLNKFHSQACWLLSVWYVLHVDSVTLCEVQNNRDSTNKPSYQKVLFSEYPSSFKLSSTTDCNRHRGICAHQRHYSLHVSSCNVTLASFLASDTRMTDHMSIITLLGQECWERSNN